MGGRGAALTMPAPKTDLESDAEASVTRYCQRLHGHGVRLAAICI